MKFILTTVLLVFMQFSFAQTSNQENSFFAQGLYPADEVEVIKKLEADIRALPFVKIIRLDINTNRFFILTKDIDQLDELSLRSWFSDKGSELKCIQIGLYGVDPVNPFPFANCQN